MPDIQMIETDGDVTVSVDCTEVEGIFEMMEAFQRFCHACGYTYVQRIGYEADSGGIYWNEF
jgi:hypothetical protein